MIVLLLIVCASIPGYVQSVSLSDQFSSDTEIPVAPEPVAAPPVSPEPEAPALFDEDASDPHTFLFQFQDADLATIIAKLAKQQGINILLPQGAQALTQKVTLKLQPAQVSFERAWQYVDFLLSLAGYTRVRHNGIEVIMKQDQAQRDTLTLYVIEDPEDLPHTDTRIRVIFYLRNLKVPEKFDPNSQDPTSMVLQDVLSPTKSVVYDQKENAIIVSDGANIIATALTILKEMDRAGQPSVLEIVPVYNIGAKQLVDLIKSQLLAPPADQKGALRSDVKTATDLYFGATPVSIVADTRTNNVILMGPAPALERIRLLITELDQTPDSGQSLLHYYELQYLDAEEFAPILERILKGPAQGAQSTKDTGGFARSFEDVIIAAEKMVEEHPKDTGVGQSTATQLPGQVYRGGNRLIITAKNEDWLVIKELLRSLDWPQEQVIVECMLLDAVIDENKILGTQFRNKTNMPLPPGVTYQAALLSSPILNNPAKNLAADLLNLITPPTNPTQSLAYLLTSPGSGGNSGGLIISLDDPTSGIWGVIEVLEAISTLKILQHPFLVVRNNHVGREDITDIRRNIGQALAGQAGVIAQKIDDVPATLRIAVVPRVSSIDRVSMQISIAIAQYTSTDINNFTRVERAINTNANLASGQVLVLGGLSRLNETVNSQQVPILSKIPLIGAFFQNNQQNLTRTNIIVLICPTVINPKVRGGMNVYTKDRIDVGFKMFEVNRLSQARDPITHLFFKSRLQDDYETSDSFLSLSQGDFVREGEFKKDLAKQQRRKSPRKKKGFRV